MAERTPAGEIHGLLTREEAWRRWLPYGERDRMVEATIGDHVTPIEASLIYRGASIEHVWAIQQRFSRSPGSALLSKIEWSVSHDEVAVSLLRESYEQQCRRVEIERDKALDSGLEYVHAMGAAAIALRDSHLNGIHQDEIMSRLIGPDGNPAFQYVPLTLLAYHRLIIHTDAFHPRIDAEIYPCTDYTFGIIRMPITLDVFDEALISSARPHEWVHAGIDGLEFYDVTDSLGERGPVATASGVFTAAPSTAMGVDESDHSHGHDEAVSEGWTDFIAKACVSHTPPLGVMRKKGEDMYGELTEGVRMLHRQYPKVYKALTRAALMDADPAQPGNKQQAIHELHRIADKAFGDRGSLDKMFKFVEVEY